MENVGQTDRVGREARVRAHRYFSLSSSLRWSRSPLPILPPSTISAWFPQFTFHGPLAIPSYPTPLSYRPPTGHDMPCVRFFRLSLPVGDTISRLWDVLLFYTAN